jgi:NADPH-dependent glutamate synthase beta subunit-like oxidoreductase
LGKNVKIIYRRTRQQMPAAEEEVEGAIEEGIEIQYLSAPIEILKSNGRVKGLKCIRMVLGDLDKSGRPRPVPVEGSEFEVLADTVIIAIGQSPDLLEFGNDLDISEQNTIKVDPETLYTGKDGVFAGGDVVTGPKTVSEAMAHGKIAAQMIDKYLRGEKVEREYKVTRPALKVEPVSLTEEEVLNLKKPPIPKLEVHERIASFREVELTFSQQDALSEAKRCLRCDLEQIQ